mmetsp:Transcript_58825/g.154942  ORF Transcript_58825/g.154942 Transcript_58825/m.154942 type:complete len:333 (-) Transcript_58825:79-1077(-)
MRVLNVGVEHEEVDAEALVGVVDLRAVVRRGHDPAVALPGVGDLLIPAIVEDAAAPVVVAEDAEPRHVVEAGPAVDALVDLVELVLGLVGHRAHGVAAVLLDASPVEVVTDVQDVLGVEKRRVLLELLRDEKLRLRVNAVHKTTAGHTILEVVAVDELLVAAEEDGVVQVVARAGEDAGAGLLATLVDDEAVPASRGPHVGPEGAVQAAPVADGEDVRRTGAGDRRLRPGHARVGRRVHRRPPRSEVRGRVELALVLLLSLPVRLLEAAQMGVGRLALEVVQGVLAQLEGVQGALAILVPCIALVVEVQRSEQLLVRYTLGARQKGRGRKEG